MKRKNASLLRAGYVDPDELFTDEDDYDGMSAKKKGGGQRKGTGGLAHSPLARAGDSKAGCAGVTRTRPTNNQLLYKAYFRWAHYPGYFKASSVLPSETDACASVTSAFLQVLHTLHAAEHMRSAGSSHQRSVLQILSTNTRRTKVVELSSGTHRVPDELKKHYLSDGEGGQYSTNLDRNRYGNDDNYLFTVIRYDLEFLGLCPCMVDVEIIDAKAGNQSVIVSAGIDACTCQHKPEAISYPNHLPLPAHHMQLSQPQQPQQAQQPPQLPPTALHAQLPVTQPISHLPTTLQPPTTQTLQPPNMTIPTISGAGLEALQAAQLQHIQLPIMSQPQQTQQPEMPVTIKQEMPGPGMHQPLRSRQSQGASARGQESPKPSGSGVSQLFDALVTAATGGQEGAAAGEGLCGEPPVSSAYLGTIPAPGAGAGNGNDIIGLANQGAMGEQELGKPLAKGPQLHHPPMRNKSRLWSAMSFGDMDSLQNALDAFRAEEEIASQPYPSSPDAVGGIGNTANGGENMLRQRRRKPPRGNSSFLLRGADSLGDISLSKLGIKLDGDTLSLPFDVEKSGDNQALVEGGGDVGAQNSGEAQAENDGDMEGDADHAEGGDATTGEGADEVDDELPMQRHQRERFRTRHVPRQASAVNLSHRVSTAELSRLRSENDLLRAENKRLQAVSGTMNNMMSFKDVNDEPSSTRIAALENELAAARSEISELQAAQRNAEESLTAAATEINKLRQENHLAMARVLALSNPLGAGLGLGVGHQAHIAQLMAAAAAAQGGGGNHGGLVPPGGLDATTLSALAGVPHTNPKQAALVAAAMKQQAAAAAGLQQLHLSAALQQQQQLLAAAAQHGHGMHGVLGDGAGLGLVPPDVAAAMLGMSPAGLPGNGNISSGSADRQRGRSGSAGNMSGSAGTGQNAGMHAVGSGSGANITGGASGSNAAKQRSANSNGETPASANMAKLPSQATQPGVLGVRGDGHAETNQNQLETGGTSTGIPEDVETARSQAINNGSNHAKRLLNGLDNRADSVVVSVGQLLNPDAGDPKLLAGA